VKIYILALLLVQMIVTASGCSGQKSIDKARSAKLKQTAAALVSVDANMLRDALSGEHQTISPEEAAALLKKIAATWGDLKMLKEINEADRKTTFNKGDMHILAHWGTLPTQDGKWMIFRSSNRKDYDLRLGLLFGKSSDHVGQFVACEVPTIKQ